MKKLTIEQKILLLLILIGILANIFTNGAAAQTVVQRDSTGAYIAQAQQSTTKLSKDTGRKFRTSDGKELTIWQGPNGGYYVEVISKNGKKYKKYLRFN